MSTDPEPVTIERFPDKWSGGTKIGVFIGPMKVGQWMRDEDLAAKTYVHVKRNYRRCLCCRHYFLSAGPGNRLCDKCRKFDAGMS
jgi:hypothetical protein